MNAIPKKKLCWNCEGRVAFSEENCSYCGVYLSTSSLITTQDESTTHIAPYSVKKDQSNIPEAPYQSNESNHEDHIAPLEDSLESEKTSNGLLPFCLLLCSSFLLIFGIVLFAFSREGSLTLHWDASYWYIYVVSSVLLLVAGWRALQNVKD